MRLTEVIPVGQRTKELIAAGQITGSIKRLHVN
jgi:hypothetical protein